MKQTALYQNHLSLNAKMGPFAGYDMPLFYGLGVMKEHEWVRSSAGLFDVSHMGQIVVLGDAAAAFWEHVTPSAFEKFGLGKAKYTVLTNAEGGIIDDLIITKFEQNRFFAVINAGCKDKDIAWIEENLPASLGLDVYKDRSLLALQGPKAEAVLSSVLGMDLSNLDYMRAIEIGHQTYGDLIVSRLGYTGEDGFEISVLDALAPVLWDVLIERSEVEPIGLAARDSLRLEMGYPLYGHDIDSETSPVEADLAWVMGKFNKSFIGAERILNEKESGAQRKRVGIKITDKGIAREGALIFSEDDKQIGQLTSGGHAPTLKEAVGMGYVPAEFSKVGTKLFIEVRGRKLAAEIVTLPFVQPRTKIAKKNAA